jgi:hypothetical protein
MPPAGFEPVIPASELPQTHTLDHAATGIGIITALPLMKEFAELIILSHTPHDTKKETFQEIKKEF